MVRSLEICVFRPGSVNLWMIVPAGLVVNNDVVVRKILVADSTSLSPVATGAAAVISAVVAKDYEIRLP